MGLSGGERCSRGFALSLALLPLVGAVAYAQGLPHIPWACPLRSLTGVPCPTCGMTRAFVALASGDLATAVQQHAFAPVLAVSFVLIAGHWLRELRQNQRLPLPKGSLGLGWSLLGASSIYYGLRLVGWYHTGELAAAIRAAPLTTWLMAVGN